MAIMNKSAPDAPGSIYRRLAWLLAIWAMSAGSLLLVSLVIRFWIKR